MEAVVEDLVETHGYSGSKQAIYLQNRFLIQKKIASGGFGKIFSALDTKQNNEEVAVKVEYSAEREDNVPDPQYLYHEYKVYLVMQGVPGINAIRFFGKGEKCNALVMDMLGPSLMELFIFCDHKFSLKTVLMLADQMIALLESFHTKNYIHRDIKPENFVMGSGAKGNGSKVYLIDFGLAKRYRSDGGVHLPQVTCRAMTGTVRFVSINAHKLLEQSRRDDLEALGFMLLFFAKGHLPWQGIKGGEKSERYEIIRNMKTDISLDTLTEGLPTEFKDYMEYCRQLKYEEAPDYGNLRIRFRLLLQKHYDYDYRFDWYDKKKVEQDVSGATTEEVVSKSKGPSPQKCEKKENSKKSSPKKEGAGKSDLKRDAEVKKDQPQPLSSSSDLNKKKKKK